MAIDVNKLRDNLAAVEERIDNACARSGRQRADVTLVAVTKTVAPKIAALLPKVRVLDLGENRPAELLRLTPIIGALVHVQVRGLMTMAALQEPEACRPTFVTLRKLRDQLGLEHLSMGMSNDFEIAIEEGATFIRLGTVLFEGLS